MPEDKLDALAAHKKLALQKKVSDLRHRLLFVADGIAPNRGKYGWLEKRTGVSASKWQHLYLGRQIPTVELLLAIVQLEPGYAKWIVTGLGDVARTIEKTRTLLGEQEAERLAQLADQWRDEVPDLDLYKEWLTERQGKGLTEENDDKEK